MNLPYDVTWIAIALASFGAFSLGVSKTGFPGLAIVNVLVIAEIFGAKNSVGIILPLLVVCDVIVLPLFWKHATWKMIWPLVPVTFVSILAAWWLLDIIEEASSRNFSFTYSGWTNHQNIFRKNFVSHFSR